MVAQRKRTPQPPFQPQRRRGHREIVGGFGGKPKFIQPMGVFDQGILEQEMIVIHDVSGLPNRQVGDNYDDDDEQAAQPARPCGRHVPICRATGKNIPGCFRRPWIRLRQTIRLLAKVVALFRWLKSAVVGFANLVNVVLHLAGEVYPIGTRFQTFACELLSILGCCRTGLDDHAKTRNRSQPPTFSS